MDKADVVLDVKELVAGYEEVDVLHELSVEVRRGGIVSVIGPNGAGKSTLIKAVYGLAAIRSGTVHYAPADGDPLDITGRPAYELTQMGMNYVPQLDNVFPSLSVEENLEVGLYLDRRRFRERREHVEELFPILAERRRQRAATLSGGQRQMVGLARALMTDPDIILLDEPSAGLAPHIMDEVYVKLEEINKLGVTLFMVEQNAIRALEMSDYAYVLDMGRNRYEGAGPSLLQDQRVVDLYLGGADTAGRGDQKGG